MRKKYIDGTKWNKCEYIYSKTEYISDFMDGFVSFIDIIKVKSKSVVEYNGKRTTLYDDDYKSIVFLPDNDFWCVEAIFDNMNNIVEWYFDITNGNYVDENNKPYFDDLYLDVVLMPNGEIIVFDEDELIEAYEQNEISLEQLKKARETAQKIIQEYIPNKDFIINFFKRYLLKFTS